MGQELNLDQLSDAMRRQQEGRSNGKQLVWDRNTMSFQELSSNERIDEEVSPVNDVSSRGFYSNITQS